MAQTLKFGNGNFATKAGSTLCYDDQNGNFKPIPMDFTRASTATRVNKQGLIEVVKSNVPRIDYTDTTKGVLLLEKAATNLFPYSNEFSTWQNLSGASVISNALISPDGTLNADEFVFNGTDNGRIEKEVPTTNGLSYTFSVYLKNKDIANPSQVYLGYSQNVQGENITITNEWKRYSVSFAADASFEYPRINSDDAGSLYAYGAMFEQNSVASSYIPTQGSASTRVAETASGSGNSEVFNDSEGVLFANIAANSDDSSNKMYSLSDGTNSNRFYISLNSNNIDVNLRLGGSTQFGFNHSVNDIKSFHKISFKYKQSDFSLFVDGFKVAISSTGNIFPNGTLNSLSFDRADGVDDFYGSTKEIAYYDTILTDLELETLTSYRTWISMVNELNLNIIYNG